MIKCYGGNHKVKKQLTIVNKYLFNRKKECDKLIKKIGIIIIILLVSTSINAVASINNTNDYGSINLNNPPNPPSIEGPQSGKAKQSYVYYITLTDPDIDDFLTTLEINFGEDDNDIFTFHCADLPWYNGTVLEISNTWKRTGNYEIRARVQDSNAEWSEWSDPFSVTITKTKEVKKIYTFYLKNTFIFFKYSNLLNSCKIDMILLFRDTIK